jgi:hypothetical protein
LQARIAHNAPLKLDAGTTDQLRAGWMPSFCCVDVMDDEVQLSNFEEIVEHYLDSIFDTPAGCEVDR